MSISRRLLILLNPAALILALSLFALLIPSAALAAAPRPPWTGNRFIGSPNPPAPYAVERRFPAATFREATDFAFAPGTSLLFVSQQDGKIFAFDTRNPSAPPTLAIDLRKTGRAVDNVLGFTFHPGFATNRFIFVNYNGPGDKPDAACVARFTVPAATPAIIDPDSERIIIRWPSGGHNGCTLAFGPDGMLYISTGDGADPDPADGRFKTGQNIGDLLASVLRIDVNAATPTKPYVVPADNPFVNVPGARPEVWAFGFRNPFRMSFGPDGTLWVTDVGWEQWEMIYRVVRGGNYGWPITEGPNPRVRTDIQPGPGPILPPIHAVPHTDGASISGGQVYRSPRLPALRDAYVYGDWETGRFWALRSEGDRLVSNIELCDTSLKPVSFLNDADGDVLILDFNSGIYRFASNTAPAANLAFPRHLSASGLFASVSSGTPAPGVLPYQIRAPMWNDHARADWWLAIPGTDAIATTGGVGNITGPTWYYPSNTVLARTLSLELIQGDSTSSRRIETQILHWDGQGWNPYSYRWNTAQTDAELVGAQGTNATYVVSDPVAPGGKRHTPWRFLSRTECLRCHNAWSGEALTLQPLQLATPSPTGHAGSTEFDRLVELGVLRGRPDAPGRQTAALAHPSDTSRPVPERARSWLHANCAACHRFGAGGAAALRLNFDQPLDELRIVDVKPTRGDYGIAGARIVAPGDPWRSTLLFRIATEGAGHMPHIGSRLVDESGLALIRDWIATLTPASTSGAAPQELRAVAQRRTEIEQDLTTAHADAKAANRLLADMNGALAALAGPHRARLSPVLLAAATSHTNALVRDLLQRLLPSDQRRETLGTEIRPASILDRAGDATRGREIFLGAAQCTRCHALEGAGRAFGPELKGLARKYSRAQILDQILQPSATIAPEFRSITVTLRNETELVGFVLQRTADQLVLRDETLTDHRLRTADIRETRESALSAMPEGLLAPLTAQEASDLLAYLLAQ